MKKGHAGFSLLETMLYCMCLAILAIIWFQFLINTQGKMSKYSNQCNQLTELYGAYDVCLRDLRQAVVCKAWHTIAHNMLVWQQSDTIWVGLLFEDNKLVRYEGTYNPQKSRWGAHKKSLVADALNNVSFVRKSQSIIIQLRMGAYTIDREVFLYV